MNILVVTDNNWDNYQSLLKKISKFPEDSRIHTFYGQNLRQIVRVCNDTSKCLIRHALVSGKIKESILSTMKNIDVCVIFHDMIEFNSISGCIKKVCEDNIIPYVIVTNYTSNIYIGEELSDKKINRFIRTVDKTLSRNNLTIDFDESIFTTGAIRHQPGSVNSIIENLRNGYSSIEDERKRKSIKPVQALYDKDLKKSNKEITKQSKDLQYLNFMTQKTQWIKQMNPKT